MMHPQMIQNFLRESKLKENELSQKIFVPCLQKMSMVMRYVFRDVQFVGGNSEFGNDIQFYDIIGPDKHRLYTGLQIKKGDIGENEATKLIIQGTKAFKKDIIDTSTGHHYRIGRWVVATTGDIKNTAQKLIQKELDNGKLISFWDGSKFAEFIQDYYYEEFIRNMGIDPLYAGSQNVRLNLYDPQNPIILTENFNSTEWSDINVSTAIPPTDVDAIFLVIYPYENNLPSTTIAVKTAVDDTIIDSIMSQVTLIPIRMAPSETSCKIKLLQSGRKVKIACRGYRFII